MLTFYFTDPPVMVRFSPVIYSFSSSIIKANARATSCGTANLFNGLALIVFLIVKGACPLYELCINHSR